MFKINDDLSIYATRGDALLFDLAIEGKAGAYVFQPGEVVRMKVFGKKSCDSVVLQKDFIVEEATDRVELLLLSEDTKIGELIHKPFDYWYEVELNPLTHPQTVIGYDEDGPKVFKLFPEGQDKEVAAWQN